MYLQRNRTPGSSHHRSGGHRDRSHSGSRHRSSTLKTAHNLTERDESEIYLIMNRGFKRPQAVEMYCQRYNANKQREDELRRSDSREAMDSRGDAHLALQQKYGYSSNPNTPPVRSHPRNATETDYDHNTDLYSEPTAVPMTMEEQQAMYTANNKRFISNPLSTSNYSMSDIEEPGMSTQLPTGMSPRTSFDAMLPPPVSRVEKYGYPTGLAPRSGAGTPTTQRSLNGSETSGSHPSSRSNSRPSSRPNSRPNSRPTSARIPTGGIAVSNGSFDISDDMYQNVPSPSIYLKSNNNSRSSYGGMSSHSRSSENILGIAGNNSGSNPGTGTTNSRSGSNDNDQLALDMGMLMSQQEADYGCNMFEVLTAEDDIEIDRLTANGMTTEGAILSLFEAKFPPLVRFHYYCIYYDISVTIFLIL